MYIQEEKEKMRGVNVISFNTITGHNELYTIITSI